MRWKEAAFTIRYRSMMRPTFSKDPRQLLGASTLDRSVTIKKLATSTNLFSDSKIITVGTLTPKSSYATTTLKILGFRNHMSVLEIQITDFVAIVTLNRPEARNSLNPELICELSKTWVE